MGDIFDFDTGYDVGSQSELDDYNTYGYEDVQSWQGGNRDMETGEFYTGLNEANSGTNAESMAGWKYSNGQWTDPSGKSYNLNTPGLNAKLTASGLGKYVGAAGLGSLLGSLANKGGGGGSSAKIPQLMASRQQYAVPLTEPRSTYKPTDEEIRNYVTRPGMTDAMVARGINQFGIDPQRMAGITGLPVENVQSRYQAAMGPNVAARRPGSGGVTYFSPMQYTPTGAAAGTGIATGTGATSGTDAAKGTGIATGAGATTGTTSGGQLTPELAKYIADQKELAKFDAGIDWEHNPTTQTFNGYGMTGPVSKTLVEMQNEIKGRPAKSDTPTDIMAAVKAANPNLDWSKYNPNKMTMDYDQFDQARDAYMAKINPGFNQNKYSGAAEQAAAVVAAAANTQMLGNGAKSALAGGGSIGGYSHGGISALGGYSDGGRLLKGPGDGVSDSIPATIGGKQPARLADGEFVIPARIVSELGNGSTEAGARKLYAMMDRIQKSRRKAKNIAANTKADKHLPA